MPETITRTRWTEADELIARATVIRLRAHGPAAALPAAEARLAALQAALDS